MKKPIDWMAISIEKGFDSPESMLKEYFLVQRLTLVQISKIIKASDVSIAKELRKLNIKTMKNQGKMNGFFICQFCNQKFEGDQRNVCCTNPKCIDKKKALEIQRGKQYRKKVDAKKKSDTNKCEICGNDRGINKHWCNACLPFVGVGMIGEGM